MDASANINTAMQVVGNLQGPIILTAIPPPAAIRRHGWVGALEPEKHAIGAAVRRHCRGRGLGMAVYDSTDEYEKRKGLYELYKELR
ncbi:hypothetical protein SAMD00023353_0103010 [Rosellinia necatrix]|uniref:Uncharacterized protein n=1 Tax=Rosellinia necatrix TaxID=77044 RepID=A0A1S8A5U1_ROSNE|nr:hypothetical protein SAMD00023353_0103010 [Rosellinia necatrix]